MSNLIGDKNAAEKKVALAQTAVYVNRFWSFTVEGLMVKLSFLEVQSGSVSERGAVLMTPENATALGKLLLGAKDN